MKTQLKGVHSKCFAKYVVFPAIYIWVVFLLLTNCNAEEGSQDSNRKEAENPTYIEKLPIIDATSDSVGRFMPAWPQRDGSCYLYPGYTVIAWMSPGQREPVAIVRKRDPSSNLNAPNCNPDSLPGDFIIYNEWAEYFAGMWGDILLIDSGTSEIRSLYFYDVPSQSKVLSIEGVAGTEGWIDRVTVRIWVLSGTDMPRSLCPDIPEVFTVGVDSLFALNLKTLTLKPLGPWRCNQLQ